MLLWAWPDVIIHIVRVYVSYARMGVSNEPRSRILSRYVERVVYRADVPPYCLWRIGVFSALSKGKEFWVVVTTTTLCYFKDKDEKDMKGQFKTEGLKLMNIDDHSFKIFDPSETKKMYKDDPFAMVRVVKKGEKDEWQASLLRAGIYPVKDKKKKADDEDSMDPLLESQVSLSSFALGGMMAVIVCGRAVANAVSVTGSTVPTAGIRDKPSGIKIPPLIRVRVHILIACSPGIMVCIRWIPSATWWTRTWEL